MEKDIGARSSPAARVETYLWEQSHHGLRSLMGASSVCGGLSIRPASFASLIVNLLSHRDDSNGLSARASSCSANRIEWSSLAGYRRRHSREYPLVACSRNPAVLTLLYGIRYVEPLGRVLDTVVAECARGADSAPFEDTARAYRTVKCGRWSVLT